MKKIIVLSLIFITFISFTGCIQQTTVKNHAEIEITPSTSVGSYSNNNITIPIYITPTDKLYSYSDPVITFQINIIPPTGSQTKDFDYLLFKVHDFDTRMFKHSNGIYQFVWEDSNNTFLVNGEKRLYMMDTYSLQLTLRFDQSSLIDLDNTELYVTFYLSDDSWSETFKIKTLKVDT